MQRSFYLDLAATSPRLPIATHLVLHERPDPEAILTDGERLADVVLDAARRFGNPLALPMMDLTVEKDLAITSLGVPADSAATYHFAEAPGDDVFEAIDDLDPLSSPRMAATCDALRRIAADNREVPVGMCIGPFSLMTKLIADPITPVYLAGSGVTADEDEEVACLLAALKLAEVVVVAYARAQIDAGAKALFLCEPAASSVYFSPHQLEGGSTVFEDLVIEPNRRFKAVLDAADVDLIFHDCGELSPHMIQSLAVLDPVIFSFGSSVNLWDAAAVLPAEVVVWGNLPSKRFYSDAEVPLEAVPAMVAEIDQHLKDSGHPYIVSSECDVLAMPGYEQTIMAKVQALANS